MKTIVFIGFIFIRSAFGTDGNTCCYGENCPLPLFTQYTGNWTFLLDQGVISASACCPSGGHGTASRYSDITSACYCSRSQACPSWESTTACPYGEDCPDSNFVGPWYNYTGGTIQLNYDSYCLYTPEGASSRGMSQRCPEPTICYFGRDGYVNFKDPYAGTYHYDRLYNGFPAYKREDAFTYGGTEYDPELYIAVIDEWGCQGCFSKWSVVSGEPWGSRSFLNLADPADFGDVTSIEFVENGECSFPTTNPTALPTSAPTLAPSNSVKAHSGFANVATTMVTIFFVGIFAI